jgi:hypothetical protein
VRSYGGNSSFYANVLLSPAKDFKKGLANPGTGGTSPGSASQRIIEADGAQEAVSPGHHQRDSALLGFKFEFDRCAIDGGGRGCAGAVQQQVAAAAQGRCRTDALRTVVACRCAAEALHACARVQHVRQPCMHMTFRML